MGFTESVGQIFGPTAVAHPVFWVGILSQRGAHKVLYTRPAYKNGCNARAATVSQGELCPPEQISAPRGNFAGLVVTLI